MGKPQGDGDDFSGIDPQHLWELIGSIKSHATVDGSRSAQAAVNDWRSKANSIGLLTTELGKLDAHFAWARDQIPMLTRRHSLAADQAKEEKDFGVSGMVPNGAASLGNYPTQAAAKKAAQADAKKYKDGKMSAKDYYAKLQENQFDPDYSLAAVNALGETKLFELEQETSYVNPDDPDQPRSALANTVATAMRGGATFKDPAGHEDIALLSPLVPDAPFPKNVLLDLADQSRAVGNFPYADNVWKGLGHDPAASTEFLHDHPDLLGKSITTSETSRGGIPSNQVASFATVIASGTQGSAGSDPNMAAANATTLVKYFGNHPNSHTYGPIQQVFAQDIDLYWNDMVPSVTDPAPVDDYGPGHVSVSADEWKGFIDESMRDPHSAAYLMALANTRSDELANSDHHNPEIVHASTLLQGFFNQQAVTVYQQMGADKSANGKQWQTSVSTWLNSAELNAVNIVFDPSAVAVPLTKAVLTQTANFFTHDIVPAGNSGKTFIPKVETWQGRWQSSAAMAYTDDSTVGDPKKYAALYSDGKPFLDENGKLVPDASKGQQRAYNAWLQDPATSKKAQPYFAEQDSGHFDGLEEGQ
ncbi:hypothetical protein [Streptomyces sp. NBC_00448]|uniref:hypothetical protein n=1 Tax=Streptomyces sp. NBC_00448 TaxID=2903652 RepID=UPI002E238E3F